VAVLVGGTAGAAGLSLGTDAGVVALLDDHSLLYWGAIMINDIPDATVPTPLAGFPPAVAVASGSGGICVLDTDLNVWCLDRFSCLRESCPSWECIEAQACPNTPVKVEIPPD
jgi:hypothetical protein